MALKRDKLCIAVSGPPAAPVASQDAGRADEAILALARLIGRQIAREQFERKEGRDRNGRQRKDSNSS